MPIDSWSRSYKRARLMGMAHVEAVRYADRIDTLNEEHGESYLLTAAAELRVALNGALNCESCGGTGVVYFTNSKCDCRIIASEILARHSPYLATHGQR